MFLTCPLLCGAYLVRGVYITAQVSHGHLYIVQGACSEPRNQVAAVLVCCIALHYLSVGAGTILTSWPVVEEVARVGHTRDDRLGPQDLDGRGRELFHLDHSGRYGT